MSAPSPPPARRLDLVRQLGARTLPLAVLVVAVVALVAPVAFFGLRLKELRNDAALTARDAAARLRREIEERPRLWRYDAVKIVDQLAAFRTSENILDIVVVDAGGWPIERHRDLGPGRLQRTSSTLWQAAEVRIDDQPAAAVWVAFSIAGLRHDTLLLLVCFGGLGLVLAGLTYGLPLQAMAAAESRILELIEALEHSQHQLSLLNRGLEAKVADRTRELEQACSELQAKERNLRELSSRAVTLQESERCRIARELHDSAGQALTAIRINLQLVAEHAAGDEDLEPLAARTLDLVDLTLDELRRTVHSLGPAILDDVGLTEAIERYAKAFAERTRLEVDCDVRGGAGLPGGLESSCYRIIQEALTNVARHAAATRVMLALRSDAESVTLRIEDDGCGFDPEAEADGNGLRGIAERVELCGGHFTLEAAAGCGTRMAVTLPVGPPSGPTSDLAQARTPGDESPAKEG